MGRFFFVGDFCSRSPEKITISKDLQGIMDSCNYRFLNFEGPIHRGTLNIPNGNVLPQSDNSPAWCEEHGFNIISLSNNHALDFSETGLLETIRAFKKSKVLGAGTWDDAYRITVVSSDGRRIGFLAATSSDLASFKDKWTDGEKTGCANVMGAEIERAISQKSELCDTLILISHAGVEYCNVPLPELRDRYRRLIELGVDAIIAMHPHIPQGYEIYNGCPILYSLGNFLFDRMDPSAPRHKYWDHSLSVVLNVDSSGRIEFNVVPLCCNNNSLDIEKDSEILEHEQWLTEVLDDDKTYIETVNKEIHALYPKYKGWLLSSFNAYEANGDLRSLYHYVRGCNKHANYRAALHQLREESTRWLLSRVLKQKSKSTL